MERSKPCRHWRNLSKLRSESKNISCHKIRLSNSVQVVTLHQSPVCRELHQSPVCRASDARKLERLQERGLRAVYKNKHASYTDLLERAKLPTLANRRLQDICILMYKVKHRLCPNSICNIFNEHNSTYNLR